MLSRNGKPEEIVSILKEEISHYEEKTQVSETGSVVQVGDGIATVYGLENVMYGELLEFENGATGVFVTTTADAPGTNRFEITLEKAKLVCENDKLFFYVLDVSEREYCFTATEGFAKPSGHVEELVTDGQNPQHAGVLRAFAGRILRGEPLVADGKEGIRGLMLSNAMHLSSWLGRPVTLPIDEDLFLEKLNELRRTSRVKENVQEVTFLTEGSSGSGGSEGK